MSWFKSIRKNFPVPLTGPEVTEPLNNFTPRAQQAIALARKEAVRLNHNFVGTEHVLLGLIRLGQGTAVAVLGNLGLDLETVRLEVEKQVGTGPDQKFAGIIPFTPRVKKVLALAQKEARALNHTYVGTEHILLGLLREGDGVAARVLKNLDIDIEQTRLEILKELDPNISPAESAAIVESHQSKAMQTSKFSPIDTAKRYDIYCSERNGEMVVYRNALFKARRDLLPAREHDFFAEFVELEQSDGKTIFISRSSIVRFCEPGVIPNMEIVSGDTIRKEPDAGPPKPPSGG